MREGGPRPVSAEPILIASETRPRPVGHWRARAAPPRPARQSLFERLLGRGIAQRVLRAHRQASEAEPAQHLADRALVQPDPEAGLDQGLEVDPPPAHHAVPVRVRPPLHDRRQLGPLLRGEARLAPRAPPVVQAGEALGVEAVHPVAQGLPVHAGVPRRFLPRGPLQHHGQGEHPPRRLRIPAPRRLPAQPVGAQLLPRDRDRHPRPPVVGSQPPSNRLSRSRLRARRRVRSSGRWYDISDGPLLAQELLHTPDRFMGLRQRPSRCSRRPATFQYS